MKTISQIAIAILMFILVVSFNGFRLDYEKVHGLPDIMLVHPGIDKSLYSDKKPEEETKSND